MATKSRYFSAYPSINKGYLSGGTNREGQRDYTFQDIVRPGDNAVSSNIIVQPNIDVNIFKSQNQNNEEVLKPITTDNFNIIRLSVDSNYPHINIEDQELFVDVLQGHNEENMAVSYTTPITTFSTFYRAYPVKNKFCNFRFRNETSSNIHIDYEISLTKFSQFSPPSQIGDNVEFKEMVSLMRNANEYYDDVSRELFGNSRIENRNGFFADNVTQNQIIAPVEILENTSNTFVEVFGKSDSISDAYEFFINGQSDVSPSGRVRNGIELFGTSNGSISVNRYKYIDTITFPQINTGNVSIYKNGTTDIIAYIPKDTASLSSPLYYINKIEEGVLKEVRVNGTTILQNGSIEIRLNEGENIKTIWSTGVLDGKIHNVWKPDYKLPSNSTCYAVVKNVDTSTLGNERVDVSMKILKYALKPENSISL